MCPTEHSFTCGACDAHSQICLVETVVMSSIQQESRVETQISATAQARFEPALQAGLARDRSDLLIELHCPNRFTNIYLYSKALSSCDSCHNQDRTENDSTNSFCYYSFLYTMYIKTNIKNLLFARVSYPYPVSSSTTAI